MEQLNLEVGQKVWSIQLGECVVHEIGKEVFSCTASRNRLARYYINGKNAANDNYPSVFLSNPFEQKVVQENDDGWIEPKEKADTISALLMVYEDCSDTELKKISREKLQKLLESI